MWYTAIPLALWVACTSTVAAQQPGNGNTINNTSGVLYKDPTASVDARIADLLSRMTIEDKMAQLMQGDIGNWMNSSTNAFNYSGLVANMEYKQGSFYVGYAVPQQWIAENTKKAQDYLIANTTLGIPALVQSEGIHGFLIGNATVFNSPIAFACSFNPELIQEMAAVIAQESLALGVNQLFAPVVDLARELRFGRVEETYGEDPYLAGEMGYNFVKGLQSNNVSAMVKHFAGFSAPEQGLNTGPVHGGERELRTTWLPSFHRTIIDGGAYSIMSAYHSYDGVPAVADYHTLTEILRDEWGYKYFVMSDAGGTDRLCNSFKMCATNPIDSDAVTTYALPAGNDVEMGGGSFNFRSIPSLVESGKLDIGTVDLAVSRLLRVKFEMGLFENPYLGVPSSQTASLIHTPEAVELARKLDAESIVLLENKDSILPLSKDANVAVIGPMSNFMNYGDYVVFRSQYNPDAVTPLQGIRNASTGTVTFAQGCERWSADQSGFSEAVATASAADVAVVFVGTWSRDQGELWAGLNATTGEHVDVADLSLVGAMGPLVQAVIETGKPTIVVYVSGKPITEPWISDNAAAVVQQFYPSEQGGNAIADILYGEVNPSGKLSVGIPYDVGTLPVFYDYLNSARQYPEPGYVTDNGTLVFGHAYVLGDPRPHYEFGYGLSYTNFTYSNVSLSSKTASASDTITASVRVTNSGSRAGAEVVQLYVQDVIASVVVPNKQLKGFQKMFIEAGETTTVEIPVDVSKLGVWDIRMKYTVEPGDFVVWIGSSSEDLRGNATLTVS
ncbi:glycoside hydrolase family 3 protein [Pseudovirgaria hyperparasitica]|uniref:beta-glucosidase n=1 Tax=Pseudovirgaria hyperparasitica TaxID=470096 RepID=A0A6A6W0G7_9PEZI|nr:glycoside hydrolase family 3 protein [Pseudovirgaria hyperparasitica]KAF2755586.1 glycoside hydrolase family 3 protein [Pseudovirgaria hyperparasitica]